MSMRKLAGIFLFLLSLVMSRVAAQTGPSGQRGVSAEDGFRVRGADAAEQEKLSVRVSTGYQQENFSWSIAGNSVGQNPNVLSELRWRAVGGVSGSIDLEGKLWRRWRVFAGGSKVWTRWGRLTDTDYGLDNRNDPLYRQQLPVTDGYSETVVAGVGYRVLDKGIYRVTAFAGYGMEEQFFVINGGGYAQLNSRYDARWMGPLVRIAASWEPLKRWQLIADGGYSQVEYRAMADWNLIPEFSHPVSFRHHAEGYGVRGEFGIRYSPARRIGVLVAANYFEWETGTGIDALYLQNGQQQQTQLNGVSRNGWGVRAGMEWRF